MAQMTEHADTGDATPPPQRAAGRSYMQAELQQLAADARRAAAEAGLTLLRSHCSLSGYRGVLRDSDSTVGLKNPYRAQARPRHSPRGRMRVRATPAVSAYLLCSVPRSTLSLSPLGCRCDEAGGESRSAGSPPRRRRRSATPAHARARRRPGSLLTRSVSQRRRTARGRRRSGL